MKLSVVIPTFRDGARLDAAIDSVLAQTRGVEALELCIVDDGSGDDTPERLARRARELPNLRWCTQANAGPAAARNRGIAMARGELVAFLDADDRWSPEKLDRQLPVFDDPSIGWSYTGARFIDVEGRELSNYVRAVRLRDGDVLLPLFLEHFVLTCGVVVRSGLLREVGRFREDLPVGEDYEFFLRLAERARAAAVDEPLFDRVVRPDSLSRRDYALDARIDLATLREVLDRNPRLLAEHGPAVRARLSQYHFDLAWRLASERRHGEAVIEAWRSLTVRPNVPATKTLVRSAFGTLTPKRAAIG